MWRAREQDARILAEGLSRAMGRWGEGRLPNKRSLEPPSGWAGRSWAEEWRVDRTVLLSCQLNSGLIQKQRVTNSF